MRNCSRKTHIRMLKGTGYIDEDDTPLLYSTWFMTTLLIVWVACLMTLAIT
jgi:hypothetical protein